MEEAKNTKECFVSFSCQPRTNEIDNKNNIVFIIDSDLDKKEIEEKAEGIKEDFDGSSNSPIINSFENKKENINKAPIDNFYNVVRRFRYISIYETKCRYYIIGTNKGESIVQNNIYLFYSQIFTRFNSKFSPFFKNNSTEF